MAVGPSLNCVEPLVPGRTAGDAMATVATGWTTSVTGLATATVRPNKPKGSWTHSRRDPIVNTPRRLVGNAKVDDALSSGPSSSQRIRRPISGASVTETQAVPIEGGTPGMA